MQNNKALGSWSGRVRRCRRIQGSPWLRGLAFSLVLCCLWSFLGAGITQAAQERGPQLQKPHSLWMSPVQKARMQAQAQKVKGMQTRAGKPGFPYRQAARKAALQPVIAVRRIAPLTLLDQIGLLAHPVPAAEVAGWYTEKNTRHPTAARSARLSLWMGEWELAHNQHPQVARPLFRQARLLSLPTDNVYGIAAYDEAMALFYEGAYADATASFRHLGARKSGLRGFDYRTCTLWMRHANACAAYHAVRADAGIPEPPRLDPLCGVAALASCLHSLGMPSSRQTLLNASHVTGEGNNLNDIANAARKLGASAYPVSAEDKAVIALPKPLVAYIEHDHFVALTRADKVGVSYLCSDCGPWPGGRVNLTWVQWRQLNPGLYLAVTKPGSAWDQRLMAAKPGGGLAPVRVAMAQPVGLLRSLTSPSLLLHLGGLALPKGVTVLNGKNGKWVECGGHFYSPRCPGYQCCLTQGNGGHGGSNGSGDGSSSGGGLGDGGTHKFAAGSGPGADDPVNLATGEEEYTPTDLTVYNPHGPSVTWGRIYDSFQASDPQTGLAFGVPEQSDFGNSWSQTYNLSVEDDFGDTTNNKYVYAANGSRTAFTASAVPSASAPSTLCNVQPGAPFVVYWNYDAATAQTYFQVINADRSQWITSKQSVSPDGSSLFFLIAKQIDRNGNFIAFNYTTGDTGFPLLSTITNQDGTALLFILRVGDGTGNIAEISDCYGRSVFYHVEKSGGYGAGGNAYALALDHVSQIVPTGSPNPPDRYIYGYQVIMNWEPSDSYYGSVHYPVNYLHTITVPSPTGVGTSMATINYDTSYNGPLVTSLVDGNQNTTTFTSVDASGNPASGTNYTQVAFAAGGAQTPTYTYTGSYDNSMNGATITNGTSQVTVTNTFSDINDPLKPSSVADGNGNVTHYVWDTFGNLHQKTSPRGTVTNYTWAFPAATLSLASGIVNTQQTAKSNGFALGETLAKQEGNKSPTTYAYFEPSGLIQTITAPLPGTVGGSSTAQTSFTYDNLGNPLVVTRPGNGTASSFTTKFDYGSSPAIGQPQSISDNLNEATQMHYDAQGNTTAVIDALGNETDTTYTIGNEPLTTKLPATAQTGSGHSGSQTTYLYAEPSTDATAQWPVVTLQYGPAVMATHYDESGNPIRQVVSHFDNEGHMLGVTGSTEPVSYTYDTLYRITKLIDAANHTTSYFYNAAGYLQQIVYPGAAGVPPTAPLAAGTLDTITYGSPDNISTRGYDADGNLLVRTDGRNQTTTYTYADAESFLTSVAYPSGTIGNVALAYDAYGRRHSVSDGTGGQIYSYDDNDLLISKTVTWSGSGLAAKTVSYAFNPDGSRSGMTADGQSFTYTYDAVGRMKALTNPFGEGCLWDYRANGWLQDRVPLNASGDQVTAAIYTQNALGQVTDLTNQDVNGDNLSEYSNMTYDGAGNRLSVSAEVDGGAPASYSGTTHYIYDYGQAANPALNRNQVTEETSTRGTGTLSYGYDGSTSTGPGNLTSFNGNASSFNADNQVTETGYGYDGTGNPTTYKNAALTFDPENRMTGYNAGGQTNAYSADSRRVSKRTSVGTTYFLYDGFAPVCEFSGSGTLLATNIFGVDGLISRHTNAGSTFYIFDERGNVSQRLISTGAVMDSDLYTAQGDRTGTAAQGDPFGYEAQYECYTDLETGLILCTHRYYDPVLGRFLTRDPMSYDGGINLYGYVRNNAINLVDPIGLFPFGGLYGRYCGPTLSGPGAPIDCLDAACMAHDLCLATWVQFCTPFNRENCDHILCISAVACLFGGCKTTNCRIAAAQVADFACFQGTTFVPISFPPRPIF